MKRKILIGVVVVVGIAAAASAASSSPTTYEYPDLPNNMEEVIATETECSDLALRAIEVGDWNVSPDVKSDAWDAIEHREGELGC